MDIMIDDFLFTSDKTKMIYQDIYSYLTRSYWSEGIDIKTVIKAFNNSYCAGIIHKNKQIAYARMVTDYTTFAYLCDVFVLEEFRGKGLSKKLLELIFEEEEFKNIRSIMLSTKDAHKLYEKYGFISHPEPNKIMVKKY